MGLPPTLFLTISILWSMHTSLKVHYKSIATEKGFLSFQAKAVIIGWAGFAAVRRIGAIVAFFAPSFGLFDLLYHWKYEQKPFRYIYYLYYLTSCI